LCAADPDLIIENFSRGRWVAKLVGIWEAMLVGW
jgi:hypothetical protein